MHLKLRILRGQLQQPTGGHAAGSSGGDIEVRRLPFRIGSGSDCHLCCRSDSVSPHHCELRWTGESLIVHDLSSAAGTFVNDVRVDQGALLRDHDRLKVGKIEFEILAEMPPAAVSPSVAYQSAETADPVDIEVSELLEKADEAERMRRMMDPSSRVFRPENPAPSTPPAPAANPSSKRPVKKAPGKLPPPPGIQGKDSIDAAQEALKKLFEKKQK